MKAFNAGCCHLVGEMGVQAKAKCLSCDPGRVVELVGVTPASRIIALICGRYKCVFFFVDIDASVLKDKSASYNTDRVGLM